MRSLSKVFAGLCLSSIASASSLHAQSVSFAGKTIHFVVGFEAGGPYDYYARLLAQYMRSRLPGDPTTVVDNMPGASSVIAANYLFNSAPRDGTVVGVLSQSLAVGQLLQTMPGIRYDVRAMTWIGRVTPNIETDFTWYKSKLKSVDDLMKGQFVAAGTGATSSSVIFRRLLNTLVGTKFKLVRGYSGPAAALLALEKGEVDASTEIWSGLKSEHDDLLRNGHIVPFLQYSNTRYKEMKDVPAVVELGKSEEQREILGLFASGDDLGTAIVAPPFIPDETKAALRKAFLDALADPGLQNQLKKASTDIDPLSGEATQKIASQIFSIDANVVDKAKELSREQAD